MENYEQMKLTELKVLAKEKGIKSISSLRKEELIAKLRETEAPAPLKAEKAAPKKQGKTASVRKEPAKKEPVKTDEKPEIKSLPNKNTNRKKEAPESPKSKPETEQRTARGTSEGHSAGQKNRRTSKNSPEIRKIPSGRHTNMTWRHPESDEQKAKEKAEEKSENKAAADEKPAETKPAAPEKTKQEKLVNGILEVMQEGFGFIRSDNYLPGTKDVYVGPGMIRRYRLRTGDMLTGFAKATQDADKLSALGTLLDVNGDEPSTIPQRSNFDNMTPIFPEERYNLETDQSSVAMRIMDLVSPVGKGQRGMIVSPPKAGKTTLLKEIAHSLQANYPDVHLIILLIDERPEEVTDMKESINDRNSEVIYSTFDELPEHHKRVSEMVIERAKRLVEQKKDVVILLDSITRLTRAYNLVVPPSGRTLSGGLDPAALHMPKKFFGAARNMREGGSLTILATALIDTGSRMDDVVYEEFKGTGNMELILDRKMQEKRIFPAMDIPRSGTRRDDLLLTEEEQKAVEHIHHLVNGMRSDEAIDQIINIFSHTENNRECMHMLMKIR